MKYTKKHKLSKDAERAFQPIFKAMTAKAIREKTIPETFKFWIETNDQKTERELIDAGLIEYAFTENGRHVYTHRVDRDGLADAIGWRSSH